MQYIKAKFFKEDKPTGRAYTYRTEDNVMVGDIVTDTRGSKLVVVDEPVDAAWIMAYGADKVGAVKKYEKPKVNVDELDQETLCRYCTISSDCTGSGVRGGPNGPIFPYCAEHEPEDWFDEDEYLKDLEESEE